MIHAPGGDTSVLISNPSCILPSAACNWPSTSLLVKGVLGMGTGDEGSQTLGTSSFQVQHFPSSFSRPLGAGKKVPVTREGLPRPRPGLRASKNLSALSETLAPSFL